jgi:predicted cupin superfamily sugar epimerase
MDADVKRIVETFGLIPHPEGGFFREVYRSKLEITHPGIPDGEANRERCTGSLIYFLLAGDDYSAFHRVRWTDEIWHLYAGGPLELHLIDAQGDYQCNTLTTNLRDGMPTAIVPAGNWQAARPSPGAAWALGGCSVAPGFEFADFEMPPREALVGQFPRHAELIESLTRR